MTEQKLTNMQQDILNIINECGGEATAYQVQLHAKKTRPYGFDVYFITNIDNRLQQLRKRGVIKFDHSVARWIVQGKGIQGSERSV